MVLKKWNFVSHALEETDRSLAELVTQNNHYALISTKKPEDEWSRWNHHQAKNGYPIVEGIAMNHGNSDTTYLHDHQTGEAFYLKRGTKEFARLNTAIGFGDRDKTWEHRYVYEGTFQDFKEELIKEGFTFED